ncbi:hypothetical protein RC62_507 [Flavobacterium aquidurense]|uniref:Uncharacterized protein n=1 Tax=Flavobacterium aquidurense TaxID=362413 RepID=A0A0N8VMY4_9FLAO|nr:hypothetical protein RC62_507 [Flavobacterium aquidurense]
MVYRNSAVLSELFLFGSSVTFRKKILALFCICIFSHFTFYDYPD